jgi:hypothetical protein
LEVRRWVRVRVRVRVRVSVAHIRFWRQAVP